jgi:predicted ATPase/transcriptional regulator with XRE-family HTH domain
MSSVDPGSFTSFGELLKYLRQRARLTQRQLAVAVGYSDAQITRLELGKRVPDPTAVRARFLEALDLQREPALAQRLIALAESAQGGEETQPSSRDEAPPTRAPVPTNLPAPLTRFIGRERQVADLVERVQTTRLLTLTGSGGAGKNRLALEVGAGLAAAAPPAFPDGVWLAELAPVASPAVVADALAAALGLQAMSRPAREVLADHLRDRRVLLVLDNCEHLIAACAALVEGLLRACPELHVLATSREPLNVPGEVTWRVPPLATDEAIRLFAERARAARPDFALTAQNAATAARICARLDGMPLAIELAAARVRTFTVEQIAARLDDRFRLLTGGGRTALPRQQTLRAAIDWSYGLLADDERALLRALSVFAGGWTLEAAEAVHGAGAAEWLEQLVNKSLIDADEGPAGMRYRLLETVRQYAGEALRLADATGAGGEAGEQRRARQRHLAYFTDLAQRGALRGPDGAYSWIWDATVAAEFDNTRAALSWAAESGAWQTGWRLIEGAHGVWAVLGHVEELGEWIRAVVLANPAASEAARVRAMLALGSLAHTRGDIVEGFERYREASAHAHRLGDEGLVLAADVWLGADTPDDEAAIARLNGVIRGARRAGDVRVEARALALLGDRLRLRGDLRGALAPLTEGVRLVRDIGIRPALTEWLKLLARLFIDLGDYPRARAALEESTAISRRERLQGALEDAQLDLARVGLHQADAGLVREALRECLPYFHRIDDLESVARGLALAAGLAHAQGEPARAALLLGAAAAIRRDHHTHGIYERDHFAEYDRRLPAVRAALAPADFDQAWAEGQAMTPEQAVAYALREGEADEPPNR